MDGLSIRNMNTSVQGVDAVREKSSLTQIPTPGAQGETSFAKTLNDAINSVNTLQKSADTEMQKLATGKSENIHETMIAAEKADIALRLMVQIRNKMIDAYHEVMKMQV